MFYKNVFIALLILCCSNTVAQTVNGEWQLGVGVGITKFSDENTSFIGDKNLFQIPRLNMTMPVTDNIAIDGALSFTTFDNEFISNNVEYFSGDLSVRYFYEVSEKFYPYAFTGVSLTKSSHKITPTINVGAGATYWFTHIFGINTQVYYKYSSNSFESMRSHIQITGGMVFSLDLYDLMFNGSISNGFCK